MTSTVETLEAIIEPDALACKVSDIWVDYDMRRQVWKSNVEETRRYIFATDTTQTSNSTLPWKNTTTIPKLCQTRDNLLANYDATLFPANQRYWLKYEPTDPAAADYEKVRTITNYMNWVISQPGFKQDMYKLILDYIDFGNCFATVEWDDQRIALPDKTQVGYVGPRLRRINPLDTVMNPTAEYYERSPKIVRSWINLGELKKLLNRMSNDENREEYEGLYKYLKDVRQSARSFTGEITHRDALYSIEGFSNFRDYLTSDTIEVLTFYGDIYDVDNDDLLENHVITVVDRHKLINKKPNPSYFGYPPIFHCAWRKRQDNLWGMGPLDNLVGMQYRLDHIENMKADIIDLTRFPVIKVKGFVQDFTWQPGEKIYIDEEGDVDMVQPDVNALQADMELRELEEKIERMAGSPREAMGFRTPGEKTAHEVQAIENAYSRFFQAKIKQFQEELIEPILTAMLELARRNMVGTQSIQVFDDELGTLTFQSLGVQDITGIGRIRPLAARHFAEQANLIQNLNNLTTSNLWPTIQPHFSSIKLAKLVEKSLNIEDFGTVTPYVALSEQAEAQQQAQALEEQVMQTTATASGMGEDYDLSAVDSAMAEQESAQQMQAMENQ